MSFIERNKAWILPLLGVAAAGVVYLNIRLLGGPSRGAGPAPEPLPAAQPAPAAPQPPPGIPPPAPGAPSGPGNDLWKDLRALEAPSPLLNRVQDLLHAAASVTPIGEPQGPALSPQAWARLTDPPPVAPMPSRGSGGGAPPATGVPAPPPALPSALPAAPELAFIAATSRGFEAWFGGRPYREGAALPDGRRVRRITAQQVVLEGPGGALERRIHPLVPRAVPSQEAP